MDRAKLEAKLKEKINELFGSDAEADPVVVERANQIANDAVASMPPEPPKSPEDKPWGMYEFAMSDPDETLVRIGWPTRLRAEPQ